MSISGCRKMRLSSAMKHNTRSVGYLLVGALVCAPSTGCSWQGRRTSADEGTMPNANQTDAVAVRDASTRRDIAYGTDPAQRFDVYAPQGAEDAPVIFMVHGGAWRFGDKAADGVITNKIDHWLPKGYILVSPNYRMSPPKPLQQADDVARALAAAQAQAKEWGGDPKKFVVMGHSAGAHLVSLLASDPSIATAQGVEHPWLGTIALDSAAFDVARIMQSRHLPLYDRVFADDPTLWRDASPFHRLKAKPQQPFMAVCSTHRPASCQQADAFAHKVGKFGGRVEVLKVAKSHADINHELGTSGDYTTSVDAFLTSLGLP